MSREVCLVTGVGPGTGKALVERFAQTYDVAMLARNAERLAEIEQATAHTKAYACDVSDTEQLQDVLASVRADLGAPSIVIHNAVGGAFGNFLAIEPEVLNKNFQINTMALLHYFSMDQLFSHEIFPYMLGVGVAELAGLLIFLKITLD